MSIHVMNLVWALEHDSMTSVQRYVLLALADSAGDDGGCFPSIKFIAWKTDISHRQVRRHLDALEEAGWFKRTRRHRIHGGYEYYIDVARLERCRGPQWSEMSTHCGKNLPLLSGRKRHPQRSEATTDMVTRQKNPSSEPSTTTSPRPNQHAGECLRCGCYVGKGEGILVGKKIAHRTEEACTAAQTKRSPKRTSSTYDGRDLGEEWGPLER